VTNPAVVHTYIQSRFYRSPEVVLGLPYTTSIDIWSFACIVAELVTGFPLFAANNEVDLMGSIIQVIGPPPKAFIQSASRVKQFFGTPYSQKKIIKLTGLPLKDENHAPKPNYDSKGNLRTPNSRPLSSVLNRNDPHLLDLLLSCLQWEPSKRLTPQQALQHPWFANVHFLFFANTLLTNSFAFIAGRLSCGRIQPRHWRCGYIGVCFCVLFTGAVEHVWKRGGTNGCRPRTNGGLGDDGATDGSRGGRAYGEAGTCSKGSR